MEVYRADGFNLHDTGNPIAGADFSMEQGSWTPRPILAVVVSFQNVCSYRDTAKWAVLQFLVIILDVGTTQTLIILTLARATESPDSPLANAPYSKMHSLLGSRRLIFGSCANRLSSTGILLTLDLASFDRDRDP